MKPDQLLRAILPEVLIDNFDIEGFEKSDTRFDIWLDEKKEQLREDKYNKNIISYGFGDYRTIQDYPIRGRATYLHVRKRKWFDKATGEIFSYDWDVSDFSGWIFWWLSYKLPWSNFMLKLYAAQKRLEATSIPFCCMYKTIFTLFKALLYTTQDPLNRLQGLFVHVQSLLN